MALSGNGVIDIATAFTMSPLFGRSGWDAAVCADCGVGVDALPTIAMTGRPIGAIRGSSAVLVAGSIDAMGDQIISGANDPGDVLVLCGTTMITWVVTAEPVAVPQLWTVPHHFGALSMVGGPSNAGGLFLNWARSLLGRSSGSAALEPGRVPVWAPYPRGERTPLHDPDRRAVVDGLDLTHSPAAVRRAAYEAAGFVVRHHIDRSGQPASRIVATGGGTRDPEWMQALADCTGLSVWVSAVPEGAAVGMAYVARLGVGLETDLSGADRWARTSHVVDPDPRWVAPSAARYQRFLELSAGGSGEPD
jgi:xylulokinase